MYSCLAVRDPQYEGEYLVGDQMGSIGKFKMDLARQKHEDTFFGHSGGIRSMEISKDGKRLASCCADHSIRLWDFATCKAQNILAGHHDVVVSIC